MASIIISMGNHRNRRICRQQTHNQSESAV